MNHSIDLRKLFSYLDWKYFGSVLSKEGVLVAFGTAEQQEDRGKRIVHGVYTPSDRTIVISNRLRNWGKIVELTLLHEMVHAKHHLKNKISPSKLEHGKRFEKDMLWLANHGAFKGLW